MENLPCLYIFSSLIFFLSIKLSLAADTITPTTLIHDGDKLVSSSQRFELGFFSPGKSKYRYLGIWYKQIPETAVWVANRESPIFDQNAVLTISRDGDLVLLNQTNGTIWSSNISTKAENPVAQLLDTGNLVIKDNSSSSNTSESYLWQSFDYPSDTLLQGMKLGWDLKNGLERYLTSWESADDPSPGNFTQRLDIHVLPTMCTYKGSVIYSCSGPWNGFAFGEVASNTSYLFQPTIVQNEDEVYYSYQSYSNPIVMILRLNRLGETQRLVWHEMSGGWQVFSTAPKHSCQIIGNCAPNSICNYDQTPNCKCLEGFKLKSQHNQTWPKTCVRSRSSDCESGGRFLKLDDVKLPELQDVSLNESMNLKECEAECLKNCTCRAYANSKETGGGSGCLMWFGDLIDLRKTIGNTNGVSLYIRVPSSEPGHKKLLWIVVIVVPPMVLLSFYILRRWRRKHKEKETKNMETNHDLLLFDINMGIATRSNELCEGDGDAKGQSKDSLLPLFSLASVSAATEYFSMQSKLGEGGFGPVYKGRLLNGQEVAVKRLSSQSGQGLKEFKNELMLIAKLQHRNLVRLLGCCIEQGENILIYEYMPNKSLDAFLFDPTKRSLLGWQLRVRIIEGIAQGLLYLHQYSRLRIIHRDLKASNILLDSDMNPKISDFGMARMFGGDELQGNTKRIVGTYGYMSPEYALEGLFSIKSDVFSFGVLMLETLSSKKNTGIYNTDSFNLLGYAWDMWKDDRAYELIDPVLQDEASYPILTRYINVALLCVQENAVDRPTMSDVISMINNELFNFPSPKQPAFSKVLKMENLLCLYFFSSLILFLSMKLSLAADTITPTILIRDGDKLVSSSQRFELGFFSPGKSKYRYLGIWYKQIPETAVWVANRQSPIFDQNAVLTISRDGDLVLLNQTNGTIWSSNMSTKAENLVAQLLDTGNLVIRDNSSSNTSESYLWQSFDYPSDTLLQGMKMGWDFKNGLERYLTSWKSVDDPSPGNFTEKIDFHVLPKICVYKGSAIYSCSGPWNGFAFGGIASNTTYLFQPIVVQNEDEVYYSYESYSNPIIMILRINPLGQTQRLIWHEMNPGWQIFSKSPEYPCQIFRNCAPNSICNYDQTPNCKCLEGFKAISQHNQTWPQTCVRRRSSDCKSGDRFIKLDDIRLPELQDVSLNESMNLKECEVECLKNCTCRAYANSKETEGDSGCLMWFGDLIDIRKTIDNTSGVSVYIRVPASEPGNKKLLWIVVIVVPPVALLSFYILRQWRRKHKEKETENMETNHDLLLFDINIGIRTRSNEFCEGDRDANGKSNDSWLPLFTLASVSAATENFSMQSKLGEGGFGPVYKGRLLNGQEVAVKRLSSQSGQGLKEFKNELMLIAKLQHRNLVRLLGCCIEQEEKILIYEYMPNKSLDIFLFDSTKKHLLDWQARIRIIEGIAQGLLYLHQYSRLRIIHRDLKASNILLDSDMNPKISDFGMARMLGGNELQGNTKRIVGTYGYMSPEYALKGLFSIKSDVFSFGVLMLETLSGMKNTGVYHAESFNLLGHVWDLWKDDRVHELMDPVLLDEASYSILKRYINVALLCVEESVADRPIMSDVVSMITNELFNLPSPKQPAFSKSKNLKNSSHSNSGTSEICSVNDVTISLINPR